jgi:hypothetical protein
VRVRSLQQLPLSSTNVVGYATQRLSGAHPEELEAQPHRDRVVARIDAIRAEYGQLQSDIVERIDHPALFDSAAPTTARFLAALVQAEDRADRLPLDELESLASKLEVTFEVAKAHARVVGLQHLPRGKRDDARRAGKAARLAREASTDGERRAATTQLRRILDSLALYYLPDVSDRLEIERR